MSRGLTLAVDLHVHSEGSYDARAPVEVLLEQARSVDLDAIVVTDHDAISESLKAAALAPAYGLIGLPDVEVSTAHGHLLAIGIEELPGPRSGARRDDLPCARPRRRRGRPPSVPALPAQRPETTAP